MTRRLSAPWGNRIIKTGTLPAGEFLANPANWRIHPQVQQDVLACMLNEVGFVQQVLVNLRTSKQWPVGDRGVETLVDGHLRVSLALSRSEETPVPVAYVDLDPDEEAAVLASLDPIGAMAATDKGKLAELVDTLPDDLRELTDVLRTKTPGGRTVTFEAAADRHRVVVECESATQQAALLDELRKNGYQCRAE